MRKQAVMARAEEVFGLDVAAIRENHDQLVKAGAGLGHAIARIDGVAEGIYDALLVMETAPRPALGLVRTACYFDLPELDRASRKRAFKFIGRSLLPLVGIEARSDAEPREATLGRATGWCCPDAEGHFNAALSQVTMSRRDRQDEVDRRRVSVYHDRAGEPLLFRKSFESSTALNLVPIALGRMVLPVGTIMAVDSDMNRELTGHLAGEQFTMSSYLAPQKLSVHPFRLSAWAYDDPVDRALFATSGHIQEGLEYDETRAEMLETVSIEDFTTAAHRLIELCAK